jgi:uncharacterized membrane protein
MEGFIALIVIVVLLVPILGIVSYFKTQGLIRESIGDMRSDIAMIVQKLSVINDTLTKLNDKSIMSPRSSLPEEANKIGSEKTEEPVREQPPLIPEPIKTQPVEPIPVMHKVSIETESSLPEEKQFYGRPTVQSMSAFNKTEELEKKSQVIDSAKSILLKIWNWIVVGEEYRRPNISMEFAIESTWLLRFGIIALIVCVGFFLRWSIDKGILGPEGRVSLAVIAGLGMLVTGIKNLKNKYRLLAEGLLGGGLAFLYFAIYASGPMYDLIPIIASFGLMCLVTVTAGVLALITGSQLVAILGIIGGYATPVMLSTGQANFNVLYSYMILLSLGVLGIAHKKQWRLLNYLAFVFTWGLFFGSLNQYVPKLHFTVAIIFLSILFILHSTIVLYYNILRRQKSTILEICHLLFNSILFSATSYKLIVDACGKPWPAVMSIAMAVFFIMHIYVFLKGRQHDRNILIVFIGLAGFFTAWAVPLITEKETLTICWALLAFFILWVGLRLKSNMLIWMSSLLYIIVIGRLAVWDIPRNFHNLDWSQKPVNEYWKSLASRMWTFGIAISSMFGAFSLYRHKERYLESLAFDKENNIPWDLSRNALLHGSLWCGVALVFTVLYLECIQMFSYYIPVQTPVLTSLLVLLGMFIFYNYIKSKQNVYLFASIILLIITLGKLVFSDFSSWHYISDDWIYRQGKIDILMRFLDYGVIFIFTVFLARFVRTSKDTIDYQSIFTIVWSALLFIYLTLETNTFLHWYLPIFEKGAISVLWALFAISYLVFGIRTSSPAWRYSGLLLFIIVVGKVFLLDLSDMETIYRVVAFMIVGILLLGGSFAYIKADKKFISEDSTE